MTHDTTRKSPRQGRGSFIRAIPKSAGSERFLHEKTLRTAEWRPETSSITRSEMRRIVAAMIG